MKSMFSEEIQICPNEFKYFRRKSNISAEIHISLRKNQISPKNFPSTWDGGAGGACGAPTKSVRSGWAE